MAARRVHSPAAVAHRPSPRLASTASTVLSTMKAALVAPGEACARTGDRLSTTPRVTSTWRPLNAFTVSPPLVRMNRALVLHPLCLPVSSFLGIQILFMSSSLSPWDISGRGCIARYAAGDSRSSGQPRISTSGLALRGRSDGDRNVVRRPACLRTQIGEHCEDSSMVIGSRQQAQLREDAAHVALHGLGAEEELVADGLIGATL